MLNVIKRKHTNRTFKYIKPKLEGTPLYPLPSSQSLTNQVSGPAGGVSLMDTDGSAEVIKEIRRLSSNRGNIGKGTKESAMDEGDVPAGDQSSQYQQKLIPTCISPYN